MRRTKPVSNPACGGRRMTDENIAGEETGFGRLGRWIGLLLGPALAIGLQAFPPPDGLIRLKHGAWSRWRR